MVVIDSPAAATLHLSALSLSLDLICYPTLVFFFFLPHETASVVVSACREDGCLHAAVKLRRPLSGSALPRGSATWLQRPGSRPHWDISPRHRWSFILLNAVFNHAEITFFLSLIADKRNFNTLWYTLFKLK